MERETYNLPMAEVIIYVCSLILLTAISSRRCQCDTVSSRELNTDVAEEPQGSTSVEIVVLYTVVCLLITISGFFGTVELLELIHIASLFCLN